MKTVFYLYLGWGGILVAGLFSSWALGWAWSDADKVEGVPRSMRDNPGAYRTHYVGGK